MKILKQIYPYAIILVIVVLIRTFIATPAIVDGDSMKPTLEDGDFMILNKLAKIDREDIVVINNNEGYIIKRVFGLPKDSIYCKDGILYINDEKYDDKFASVTEDFSKVILKEDEYFVLGDNRKISLDSRSFGIVHKNEIKGTTRLILFPIKHIGLAK